MEVSNKSISDQILEEGYIIRRSLIPEELCEKFLAAVTDEIRPFKGELPRVASAKQEEHYISDNGFIVNSILNVHNLGSDIFKDAEKRVFNLLTNPSLTGSIKELIKDTPVLVQSGYHEASLGSPPHFDSYFFDSINGIFVGCWIALEDINQSVGSFFVYPKSHLLSSELFSDDVRTMLNDYNKRTKHIIRHPDDKGPEPSITDIARSRKLLNKIIKDSGLSPLSFDLNAGDVVLFSSKLLHGSYESISSGKSRKSLIGHFTPRTKGFMRYGVVEALLPERINGLDIQCVDLVSPPN